ncbi:mechanosensitive ion channel family protein [Prauserella rugosa]|uniref:Small conductance mechanosensitive channel n=1 Tax=Prauserella rugosa TaxID=43354 RepID=A0A660C9A1_9PSEU|nr:mechanosensitive ion channel family protein [Prauserella rugosa]KMS91398.1 mechanosensitive ion channel protein MscS [Streptomyces regensis]TWH18393.1 small conductance mechanosensitive channel [Prauserella rugosa]
MNQLLSEPPSCIQEEGTWCQQIWQLTGNEWLAGSANWLIAKPLTILLIAVVAFFVRLAIRKLIDRTTRAPEDGDTKKTPALLKPLREKAPELVGPAVIERRRQRAKTIGSVLKSITTVVVYSIAVVLILGELGINLAPIIASAGIVGVAVGFGAQNLVRDFLSGIFMMLEDQYGVGDVVDVGEATGTVEAVGLRITTLRDLNGTVWYVRNGEVLRVGNFSQGFAVGVVDIPVSYDADLTRATALLSEVVADSAEREDLAADILEPPSVLGVESVTPEAVHLRLTVKVRPGRQWAVQRALRADAMAAFERAGFQPPLKRLFPGNNA